MKFVSRRQYSWLTSCLTGFKLGAVKWDIRLLGYKAMRNIRVFIDREKSYDWKWNAEM
jgi:hypothetical protein